MGVKTVHENDKFMNAVSFRTGTFGDIFVLITSL